jgi:hypothetical protein
MIYKQRFFQMEKKWQKEPDFMRKNGNGANAFHRRVQKILSPSKSTKKYL